ncbi:MAG: acetyl-CoA carboxylase carboxyltransferase subunit beta [Alphaproteobacteria bacterium]|nr:acetyl-CoA carboxylase carboxyltransferase subunit beta [Alphaproteobacteria bacterium]
MNWLSNFVRPKIQALVRKREVPDNLWIKCPNCGQMIHHKEVKQRQSVCQHCDHHLRIGPDDRFPNLFDDGEFTIIELPEVLADPLKFRDEQRYTDRLKAAQNKTGQKDAVVVAHGKLGGHGAVIAVQNFSFMGGSLGQGAAEAIITAAKLAVLQKAPMIIFSAAGGARMQEGILSLMQLPRSTIAVQMLQEAGLPYIAVLTDPTTGGVTASYAMLGDVAIAEPGALIGFAGPRVIENTIRERLPEGFQRAEYLLEHGMLDMVVHRHALRETLIRVVELLGNRPPSAEVISLPRPDLEIPAPTDARQKGETGEPGGAA